MQVNPLIWVQYIPRNMHTVFALLCFVVVIHWLIFPYPSGLLHWHCGNLTIAPVPAKQPWWIWINTSCEFIMNDCITTTKQSTTKLCAYFLGYTVIRMDGSNSKNWSSIMLYGSTHTWDRCLHEALSSSFQICFMIWYTQSNRNFEWYLAPVNALHIKDNVFMVAVMEMIKYTFFNGVIVNHGMI